MPPWKRLRDLESVQANDVLTLCGIEGPSVPLKAILRTLQIDYRPVPRRDWVAAVWCDDSGASIRVSQDDSVEHQRFTAAHALGHLLLHQHKDRFEDTSFSGSTDEDEANEFAFDLLIPLRFLRRASRKMWRVEPSKLARLFEVPEGTMVVRFEQAARLGQL